MVEILLQVLNYTFAFPLLDRARHLGDGRHAPAACRADQPAVDDSVDMVRPARGGAALFLLVQAEDSTGRAFVNLE